MPGAGLIRIGQVVKTHGLGGELAVRALVPAPLEDAVGAHVWFIPPPERVRSGRIERVRHGPKGPLVTVAGIDDVDVAASLVGTEIAASPEELPPAFSEEVFDPTGLEVVDERRGLLGRVEETIVTGANDVWVVRGGDVGEVLLPVIDDVVLVIDEDRRIAHVRLLPGLLEE